MTTPKGPLLLSGTLCLGALWTLPCHRYWRKGKNFQSYSQGDSSGARMKPIRSRYDIFVYICHKNQVNIPVNIGTYTIHGSYKKWWIFCQARCVFRNWNLCLCNKRLALVMPQWQGWSIQDKDKHLGETSNPSNLGGNFFGRKFLDPRCGDIEGMQRRKMTKIFIKNLASNSSSNQFPWSWHSVRHGWLTYILFRCLSISIYSLFTFYDSTPHIFAPETCNTQSTSSLSEGPYAECPLIQFPCLGKSRTTGT